MKSLIRELISLSLSSMVEFVYSFNTTIATEAASAITSLVPEEEVSIALRLLKQQARNSNPI